MSNMYPKTVTWNPLGGECSHKCEYCYREDLMRYPNNERKYSGEPRFVDVPIPTVKNGEIIFVCSMTDLFAESVDKEIIVSILNKCDETPNTYLLQTKNPGRIKNFIEWLPEDRILGTTIETNRQGMCVSHAPSVRDRAIGLCSMDLPRMVSIEPILDFGVPELVEIIRYASPTYVSIGADSKNHNLKEPPKEKVEALITELQYFTEVRLKKNLNRLLR